jgi:hypothetical protein
MKRFALAIICAALATSAVAEPKRLRRAQERDRVKIQANAVPSYTLEIVSKEEADKHDARHGRRQL